MNGSKFSEDLHWEPAKFRVPPFAYADVLNPYHMTPTSKWKCFAHTSWTTSYTRCRTCLLARSMLLNNPTLWISSEGSKGSLRWIRGDQIVWSVVSHMSAMVNINIFDRFLSQMVPSSRSVSVIASCLKQPDLTTNEYWCRFGEPSIPGCSDYMNDSSRSTKFHWRKTCIFLA